MEKPKLSKLLLLAGTLLIILLLIFVQNLTADIFGTLAFLGFILLMPKLFIGLAIGWAFFHFFF